MTKRWEDNFEALLAWLDPDLERAGAKYEDIRHSLIHIFSWRACDAEDLADEIINRVTKKVPELAATYKGDPALYFYGVAKKMLLEVNRRKPAIELPSPDKLENGRTEPPDDSEIESDFESEYECLEECLTKLPQADRELFLLYHRDGPKIDSRKQLAARLGLRPTNLRVKAHRIRAVLQKCIQECVRRKAVTETDQA